MPRDAPRNDVEITGKALAIRAFLNALEGFPRLGRPTVTASV